MLRLTKNTLKPLTSLVSDVSTQCDLLMIAYPVLKVDIDFISILAKEQGRPINKMKELFGVRIELVK